MTAGELRAWLDDVLGDSTPVLVEDDDGELLEVTEAQLNATTRQGYTVLVIEATGRRWEP